MRKKGWLFCFKSTMLDIVYLQPCFRLNGKQHLRCFDLKLEFHLTPTSPTNKRAEQRGPAVDGVGLSPLPFYISSSNESSSWTCPTGPVSPSNRVLCFSISPAISRPRSNVCVSPLVSCRHCPGTSMPDPGAVLSRPSSPGPVSEKTKQKQVRMRKQVE
jgi:hypothetical protein